jgi:putative mRNA 3-end processing factor
MASFLETRDHGLFCVPGGFYIDPWKGVDLAVVTHAHADHARPGSKAYLTSLSGERLVRERVGRHATIEGLPFGETRVINGVTVSLHPAGHIRGSAQVRMEYQGEIAVVTGDYKREDDPVAEPFEVVPCHTLVTECTFGLPVYRWRPAAEIFADINAWWRANRESGVTSVILCYSLGKAQRLLAGVDASIGPILCHGAIERFVHLHRGLGVDLPNVDRPTGDALRDGLGKALVLAPPATLGTKWMSRFDPSALAFASGWMQIRGGRRRQGLDKGFPLSDHADWPGLLQTVRETGATTVWATHGFTGPFARHVREEMGLNARELETRFSGNGEEPPEVAGAEVAEEAAP